jgi:hypothetical protein
MNMDQLKKGELAWGKEALGENSPVSFCPSQIPHALTWNRTRAALGEVSSLVLFTDAVSINFLNLNTMFF